MSRNTELEKKIDAYVKGKLSEEEAQKLWEELLLHPEYIDHLKTELGLKEILEKRKSKEGQTQDDSVLYSVKRNWKWVAAAASVAILVVALNFFQMNTNQPINEIALQNINLTSHLASAPVMRSEQESISSADSLLNKGFEAALAGNSTEAVQLYKKIVEEFPNSSSVVKAHLNIGILHYNSRKYEQSIASFSKVIKKVSDQSVAKEKAYWYMGNAYLKLGELENARNAIHEVYTMDGIFKESAYKVLQNIDYELRKNNAAKIN